MVGRASFNAPFRTVDGWRRPDCGCSKYAAMDLTEHRSSRSIAQSRGNWKI